MLKILVTGANGFIGSTVCAEARVRGMAVWGVTRAQGDLPAGDENFVVGEIDGTTAWREPLTTCNVVVHLAARVHVMKESVADPLSDFRRVNVDGTLNLARQAVAAGVRRFVFVSSIGVNGLETAPGAPFSEMYPPNPHNAYALSKWEAEQGLLRVSSETGLDVVILRPPLVYGFGAPGNFGALMRAVQHGWPLPLGAVHNRRSLVALNNLVDFIMACATHPQAANQTFLVSDGQDLSTTELVRRMAQVAGVKARLLPVPLWALQAGAALVGRGDVVQRICGNLQVDISKARSLLGWVPPISVEEGLRRTVAEGHKP